MSIINILASQNFIVLNKTLIKQLGLHNAVVLSELCQEYTYWHKEKKLKEGWFYSSQNNISENIGLSTRQISNAVQELINQQLISIKLVGMPAITHYFIDEQNLTNLLCKNCITSNAKNDIQEEQILHTNNNNNSIKNNINKERDKQVFDIGIKIFQKQLSVIEAEVIIN